MTRRAARTPSTLDPSELAAFETTGFVRLERAVPPDAALAMQAEVWAELAADHGIREGDRSTWRTPPHGARRAKHSAGNAALVSDRLFGAIGDLLGKDDWRRPASWGGYFVTFPSGPTGERMVPTDTWHWDAHPDSSGLLLFTFCSSVEPGGGGTLVLAGSHRVLRRFYMELDDEAAAQPHCEHRRRFARWHPYLEALTGHGQVVDDRVARFCERDEELAGVPCRVVELTGEPGDVVACNPGLLHATVPNRSSWPRFVRVKFLLDV